MSEGWLSLWFPNFVRYRFLYLLVCILSYLILSPMLSSFAAISVLADIFITWMLIASVLAVSQKKRYLIIGVLLTLPMITSTWGHYFVRSQVVIILNDSFGIIFFAYTTIVILTYVLRERNISAEVIQAAILVYLLAAVTWSYGYSLLEEIHPESFSVVKGLLADRRLIFLYYSFVTITTLGYGDITPITSTGSSLAIVEAVMGQIYIAVLVARLVGVHVAQTLRGD